MLKTVLAVSTAVELVATAGIIAVAMHPEFVGARRAFLRQAKGFIEDRHFKAGSVGATLDAVTLRDINNLHRTSKDGWRWKDFAALHRVTVRTGTPLMLKGAKVAFDAADAKIRQGVDRAVAWGESILHWPATPQAA